MSRYFRRGGAVRIGIPVIGSRMWHGGVVYVQNLLKALRATHAHEYKAFLLATGHLPSIIEDHAEIFDQELVAGVFLIEPGDVGTAQTSLRVGVLRFPDWESAAQRLDVVYPWLRPPLATGNSISWIPDFQYCHLPRFFSEQEAIERHEAARAIALQARNLFCSSYDVAKDFRRLFPESACDISVLHFHTSLDIEVLRLDPLVAKAKYHIDGDYLACCNQFWAHKDHRTVFEAIRLLLAQGRPIQLVCTGNTSDHRNPTYFQELMSFVSRNGLGEHIRVLGMLPRIEQLAIMRGARAVVQPSLFEGWSTVVEDARALGCPIFLSDLAVHKEQAPPFASFFKAGDAEDLAQKVITDLDDMPSPGHERETGGRAAAERKCAEFGNALWIHLTRAAGTSTTRLLVATSIAPTGIERQQECIRSWIRLGVRVVSLNNPEEIELLRPSFPDVTFHTARRNAAAVAGRPLVFFDDVLALLGQYDADAYGIVNSDIELRVSPDDMARLAEMAQRGVVFGHRIDIDTADAETGTRELFGHDFFFFPRPVLGLFPPTPMCIGAPWWDYWVLLIPSIHGVKTVRWEGALGYHVKHPVRWDETLHRRFGTVVKHHHDRLKGAARPQPVDQLLSHAEDILYSLEVLGTFGTRSESHYPSPAQSTVGTPVAPATLTELWWDANRPVRSGDDLLLEIGRRVPDLVPGIRTLYQVGAHLFEEGALLRSLLPAVDRIVLFEPLPDIFQQLVSSLGNRVDITCLPYAISDSDGPALFRRASYTMSSSLLPMKTHRELWPDIHEVGEIEVQQRTLATAIREHNLPVPDLLYLDVQGSEYQVLSSIPPHLLSAIQIIYTEASTEEIYAGARSLQDIVRLLSPTHRFMGFAPQLNQIRVHGNAVFLRNDLLGWVRSGNIPLELSNRPLEHTRPPNPRYSQMLSAAYAQRRAGHVEASIRSFLSAAQLEPERSEALVGLIDGLRVAGLHSHADELISELAARFA